MIATKLLAGVRKVIVDDLASGRRSTRSSAQGGFGIDFRIGLLGTHSKGALDSEGVPVVRILHDGTRDTEVYNRIRVLDLDITPMAAVIKRVMRTRSESQPNSWAWCGCSRHTFAYVYAIGASRRAVFPIALASTCTSTRHSASGRPGLSACEACVRCHVPPHACSFQLRTMWYSAPGTVLCCGGTYAATFLIPFVKCASRPSKCAEGHVSKAVFRGYAPMVG